MTFKREVEFDADQYTVTVPTQNPTEGGTGKGKGVTLAVFDKVTVNILVEKDQNTQRGKIKMVLVHPVSSEGI